MPAPARTRRCVACAGPSRTVLERLPVLKSRQVRWREDLECGELFERDAEGATRRRAAIDRRLVTAVARTVRIALPLPRRVGVAQRVVADVRVRSGTVLPL